MRHAAAALESVWVDVPEAAVPAYEAALAANCESVGFFLDEISGLWRVQGVRQAGRSDQLASALALAQASSGIAAVSSRSAIAAEGWLARTASAFPEQRVGRRFTIRGTHLPASTVGVRLVLRLDAGVAFGSGEHGSTRGCLRALEAVAHRRPRRILDLGTGSGVLALAACRLWRRRVLATDIDPWSVRVAGQNARLNQLGPMIRTMRVDGWRNGTLRAGAPFDLVFANILARPLCRMALPLSRRLAPGGTAILSGLLHGQARQVLAAHRRQPMVLQRTIRDGNWSTLVLRRRR